LLRGLFNVREAKKASAEFLKVQDKYLQLELKEKGITKLKDLDEIVENIYLWRGDITTLKVDAIVNAANNRLLGCFVPNHKCIDNAIHTYSGIQLRESCNEIMEKQIDKESISKRDIILNESFRLFLKKGYAAVSFSDLVEATGISRGNMFHHFKNKEDIFNHAVDRFVFEFLTNDATDFLELTSSTPLKDFIDNRVENIGRRMKSFFIMTKGTVTPANFMSFILYLKDNYPDWKEKFQEYEKRKSLEWKEVIELAKQKGEITQTVETEKIISSIRNIYLGLSYRSALSSQLSISELKEQIYTIYYLITK